MRPCPRDHLFRRGPPSPGARALGFRGRASAGWQLDLLADRVAADWLYWPRSPSGLRVSPLTLVQMEPLRLALWAPFFLSSCWGDSSCYFTNSISLFKDVLTFPEPLWPQPGSVLLYLPGVCRSWRISSLLCCFLLMVYAESARRRARPSLLDTVVDAHAGLIPGPRGLRGGFWGLERRLRSKRSGQLCSVHTTFDPRAPATGRAARPPGVCVRRAPCSFREAQRSPAWLRETSPSGTHTRSSRPSCRSRTSVGASGLLGFSAGHGTAQAVG